MNNMKLVVLLCAVAVIADQTTHKPETTTGQSKCEGVYVHNKPHKRHILMNGLNRPYQLSIYTHKHQIFYSYNKGAHSTDAFGIAYIKINDTMPTEVEGVKDGFALAIDEENKKLYLGGSEGIYEADLAKFEGLICLIKGDIWDLFYHNDHLYYIDFPAHRVHKYDLKEKKDVSFPHVDSVTHKVYQFAIDGNHDMFLSTKHGLFEIKSGTNFTIPYGEPKIFRAIGVNRKGVAHFCAQNGIYEADKKTHTLTKLVSIKNIFGLTFDKEDNIIYSNPHEIVKLVPYDCE